MTVKVGILGAGDMGRMHGDMLSKDARVQVVAVADLDAKRADLLAHQCGARPLETLDQLLDCGLDAIYITSPNWTHLEAVTRSLSAGLHVFSEKPMAISMTDAKKVLEAVERSPKVYQLGFNRRFAPVYKFCRERVEAGFKPYVVNIRMNEGEMTNRPWITDRARTGGYLNENTIHFMDMLRWLVGDPTEVFALGEANCYADQVDFVIAFKFDGGRMASITTSGHASWFYPWERMEIVGDHEALVTEEVLRVMHSPGVAKPAVWYDYFQVPKPAQWGYEGGDRSFVSAVLGEGPSAFTASEGYKAMALVEACYESIRTGQKVVLRKA
ncbi:MAG: Gfo/Idh/MocA family oxidoreductase [Candidatus Wallbacteria bacterium]|nr:Gfo/Idh/MocA family oxidoreductase [Candidatus Wallbacteria bacterium]